MPTATSAGGTPAAKVLVAYASRHGSTVGVAERLAQTLREHGNSVELCPAPKVESVSEYDAVVFGSPVYNQAWLPEGEQFVRRNMGPLALRPLWLFSVGTFGDTRRLIGPLMKREPRRIGGLLQALHPRDYRVFCGGHRPPPVAVPVAAVLLGARRPTWRQPRLARDRRLGRGDRARPVCARDGKSLARSRDRGFPGSGTHIFRSFRRANSGCAPLTRGRST